MDNAVILKILMYFGVSVLGVMLCISFALMFGIIFAQKDATPKERKKLTLGLLGVDPN